MTHWLVDTQLIADWCLWELADEPHSTRRIVRAAATYSVLRVRRDLKAFVRKLERSGVLLAESVLVEVSGVVRRELSNAHKGTVDRLNEPVVRMILRFTNRFSATVIRVTEADADAALRRLNSRRGGQEKPFDFGDASLIAALSEDRVLLTADEPLRNHCVNVGQANVFYFSRGEILDARGNPIRDRV
ncbi:MAG: hypothetical protein ACYC8T_15535 [Myxococcaceae bacterium]